MTASGPALFDLTGRVAVVTGSSRGIGLALARALAEAGAHVVLNARSADALDSAVADLVSSGLAASGYAADVTDPDDLARFRDRVVDEIGPVDILVNNAGAQHRGPFLEFDTDDFRRLIELNLVAPFTVAQAFGAGMVERGEGKIINICSVQSELGRPTIVPYTATKGGLALMTRGLCAELASSGVQVNAIAPGYFATELTEALVADAEFSAWLEARTPAGRWGRVDELAGSVVFLASAASSFVNGQVLYVDGGMTAAV